MHSSQLQGLLRVVTLLLLLKFCSCLEESETCNRIPLNSKTAALPPDNRFALEIEEVDNAYIPDKLYIVKLYSKDPNQSKFIAFTIFATGDTKPNPKNFRNPIPLSPGHIRSSSNSSITDTISKPVCENTVFEADITPKTSVQAEWLAPPKGSKCVTISAYVAVKSDVWYRADGPLSKQICEDHRKKEDMKPMMNTNCQVCEEARYQLEFQGTWSKNTHLLAFPKDINTAKFSDIVGASHNNQFDILVMDNRYASGGLKMLAEQGNTTSLEHEILKYLGTNVRTVIKATRPSKPYLSTFTSFRTSQQHHMISLAASIIPSPDWFLGTYNLELCDAKTKNWADRVVLNLYPMDAGTDSGLTFESAPEPTTPPKMISKAEIVDLEEQKPNKHEGLKPFAKIIVTLVRTYESPDCTQMSSATPTPEEEEGAGTGDEEEIEEPEPSRPVHTTRSPPIVVDADESDDCQVTSWEPWLPCEGPCVDNKVVGYQSRFRYYVIDGKIIGKDFDDEEEEVEVPEDCLRKKTSEMKKCEDECDAERTTEETPEAQQGNWREWVKPGQRW